MSDGLHHLMHPIVGTSPVQDPHPEQAKGNRIVDTTPINLLEPFSSSDHVCPELIIKEEVWVHVPPPLVVNDRLIIWLSSLHNPVEGVLGDLSISISVLSRRTKREITLYINR